MKDSFPSSVNTLLFKLALSAADAEALKLKPSTHSFCTAYVAGMFIRLLLMDVHQVNELGEKDDKKVTQIIGASQKTVMQRAHLNEPEDDWIAQEVPVALVYNGISHVVMMASPKDLQAFALGFSLSEGIIESVSDIYGMVRRFIPPARAAAVQPNL
jgi:hypothetical protein